MTTALAVQRLPLPAKRNGAWVARQRSAHRNPHNPQEQGQPTNRATRKRRRKRTANAPFRLATLPYRKRPAFPKLTALTLKYGLVRPNGTSDSQGQKKTEFVKPLYFSAKILFNFNY
ncbi:MAG: hypothetical protein J6T87_00910 [Bacteroidales bacterium]|nr:hypothetical protein [Bacteroidales bacterium]